MSDEATKNRLREEYRAAKKERLTTNRIGSVIDTKERQHSAIFGASFFGKVSHDVLADQGADANLLFPDLLQNILQTHKVSVTSLNPPRTYNTISGDVCVRCDKPVVLDVRLKIRHGSNLMLRNVVWEVTKKSLESAILGRRVLESLGCDNRSMLEAARNRNDGDIDVPDSLPHDNDETDGIIAALFGESLYHMGDDERDGLKRVGQKDEFGDDPPLAIKAELRKRVQEAREAGLSPEGAVRLTQILTKFEGAFKLRLGSGGPAPVPPMKIELK